MGLPERTMPPGGGTRKTLAGETFSNKHTTPRTSSQLPADTLLARLERVKETGPGQWIACCPAHADRSPSLSIKQTDDRLLVHCFAGCPASDVVAAVGLTLSDLFDKPLSHHRAALRPSQRKRHDQARAALQALIHECRVVACAADQMAAGFALDADEIDRLSLAVDRIKTAEAIAR